jgi:transcriptional regulator with XRE-family HTH domain
VSSTPENITVRFGKRLRKLRVKQNWAQIDLAEKLGIDRSYISDMERGKKNVCLPTLENLAQALNTTISKILHGL